MACHLPAMKNISGFCSYSWFVMCMCSVNSDVEPPFPTRYYEKRTPQKCFAIGTLG